MPLSIERLNRRARESLFKITSVKMLRQTHIVDMRSEQIDSPVLEYEMTSYLLYHSDVTLAVADDPFIRHNGVRLYADIAGIADAISDARHMFVSRDSVFAMLRENIAQQIQSYFYFDGIVSNRCIDSGFYDEFLLNPLKHPMFMMKLSAVRRVSSVHVCYPFFDANVNPDYYAQLVEILLRANQSEKKIPPEKVATEIAETAVFYLNTPQEMEVRIYAGDMCLALLEQNAPLAIEYGYKVTVAGEAATFNKRTKPSDYMTKVSVETAEVNANSKDRPSKRSLL